MPFLHDVIILYSSRLILTSLFQMDWHRMVAVGWTGIMTTVVAIYFEGLALQVASANEAALTFASEPVWASLFGAWLLKEQLGPVSYIGGSIDSCCLCHRSTW
jgi:drug/metabolite transporter (DMT)-like permease